MLGSDTYYIIFFLSKISDIRSVGVGKEGGQIRNHEEGDI